MVLLCIQVSCINCLWNGRVSLLFPEINFFFHTQLLLLTTKFFKMITYLFISTNLNKHLVHNHATSTGGKLVTNTMLETLQWFFFSAYGHLHVPLSYAERRLLHRNLIQFKQRLLGRNLLQFFLPYFTPACFEKGLGQRSQSLALTSPKVFDI